jgi:hypothetical protein
MTGQNGLNGATAKTSRGKLHILGPMQLVGEQNAEKASAGCEVELRVMNDA